jgi:hypothetical protein
LRVLSVRRPPPAGGRVCSNDERPGAGRTPPRIDAGDLDQALAIAGEMMLAGAGPGVAIEVRPILDGRLGAA